MVMDGLTAPGVQFGSGIGNPLLIRVVHWCGDGPKTGCTEAEAVPSMAKTEQSIWASAKPVNRWRAATSADRQEIDWIADLFGIRSTPGPRT